MVRHPKVKTVSSSSQSAGVPYAAASRQGYKKPAAAVVWADKNETAFETACERAGHFGRY